MGWPPRYTVPSRSSSRASWVCARVVIDLPPAVRRRTESRSCRRSRHRRRSLGIRAVGIGARPDRRISPCVGAPSGLHALGIGVARDRHSRERHCPAAARVGASGTALSDRTVGNGTRAASAHSGRPVRTALPGPACRPPAGSALSGPAFGGSRRSARPARGSRRPGPLRFAPLTPPTAASASTRSRASVSSSASAFAARMNQVSASGFATGPVEQIRVGVGQAWVSAAAAGGRTARDGRARRRSGRGRRGPRRPRWPARSRPRRRVRPACSDRASSMAFSGWPSARSQSARTARWPGPPPIRRAARSSPMASAHSPAR